MKAEMIAITGNTYPVKEQLKSIGARWNPDKKTWMVSEDQAEQARQIVAGAGAKKPYTKYAAQSGGWRGHRCSCDCEECSGRCSCESHCNCRGGNVYDC